MTDLSTYKLRLERQIDWSDLDRYEHVNNLTFIRYLQSGRVNFWEATGLDKTFEETNKGPMLVSTHCNFRKSLHYPGKATILTKLAYMKNSSFGLDHIILNQNSEICAEGRDIAVCYDFNNEETYNIPRELRDIMSQY